MAKLLDLGPEYNFWNSLKDAVNSGSICIKNCTTSVQRNGALNVTLTMLGTDMSAFPAIRGVEITKISKTATGTNVTIVDKSGILANVKVPVSAIFKSVSEEVVKLHESKIIPTEIVSPIANPEAEVFIKSCQSLYEDDGWTVREILDVLDVKVYFPAAWNYHVTQLTVQAGTPVVSLLSNLFPFPAVTFSSLGKIIIVGSSARLQPPANCTIVSQSEDTRYFHLTVIGQPGEVRYIRGGSRAGTFTEDDPERSGSSITYILNLVGGVFGVSEQDTSIFSEDLPTSYWK